MTSHLIEDARRGAAIQASFCPRIAIFASQDVDQACQKNNIPDLVKFLRPFEYVDRVSVRHSNYSATTLDSFRLSFFKADELLDPESRPDEKDWIDNLVYQSLFTNSNISTWLNSVTTQNLPPSPSSAVIPNLKIKREHEWLGLTEEENEDYPQPPTPWYIAFLNLLFEYRPLVEYDSTSHPIAAMIVVSTNNPEPLNEFSKLYETSGKDGSGWPAKDWLETGTILRYYLLVHEINDEPDGGKAEATELFDAVKRAYGLNCGLLFINSEKTEWLKKKRIVDQDPNFINPETDKHKTSHDYWSKYLTHQVQDKPKEIGEFISEEDVLGLKVLLREFTLQSLVPHIERIVQQTNDTLAASRKGITGRLFSAGKKYLSKVPGSTSSPNSEGRYNSSTRSYPYQTPEAQTRRLADLSFMLRDYKFASQMYEYLRKDAYSDKAWSYYSSATQMIGLCTLLQSSFNQRTKLNIHLERFLFGINEIETSVSQLKMVMVYYEMAKAVGNPNLMSASLIRIATISNDLVAGLIYEQVARIVSHRQAALYIVLAAHRYTFAKQDWLSKICLRQCPQINGCSRIEDYVDDRMAQIATLESDLTIAAKRYWNIIKRRIDSGLYEEDDEVYMVKFRTIFRKALEANLSLSSLGIDGVSLFDVECCKIRIPHQNHLQSDTGVDLDIWDQLNSRYSETSTYISMPNNLNSAIINEPFYLDLFLQNPLKTSITITNITIGINNLSSLDQPDNLSENLQIEPISDLELLPLEHRHVSVKLGCKKSSIKFEIADVKFKFDSIIDCSQKLKKKGKRLQTTLTHRLGRFYSEDQSMIVTVRDEIPILELDECENLPTELYAGESRLASISIRNVGQVGMKHLRCVSSHDHFFRFCSNSDQVDSTQAQTFYETDTSGEQLMIETPNHVLIDSPTLLAQNVGIGESIKTSLVCRGDEVGKHLIYWLFEFQHAISGEVLYYRHRQCLNVLPSLNIKPVIRSSFTPDSFYLVTLELDHLEIPEDVEIYQVSTMSTHWNSRCIHYNNESSNLLTVCKGSPPANLVFELQPHRNPPDDSTTQITLQQLRKILNKEKIEASAVSSCSVQIHVCSLRAAAQPVVRIDSSLLLNTILSSHRNLRRKALQSHFTTLTMSQICSMFPLTSSRSVDLLLFWRTKSGLLGHHYISDLKFGATRDLVGSTLDLVKDKAGGMYQQSQQEQKLLIRQWRHSEYGKWQDPVAVDVSSSQQFIDWNFDLEGPLTIPVKFTLRNLSTNAAVDYNLSLLREGSDSQNQSISNSSMVETTDWIGRLRYSGRLKGLEKLEIDCQCWVSRPGLTNIGSWRCESKFLCHESSQNPPDPDCAGGKGGDESPLWTKVGSPVLISVADLDSSQLGKEAAGTVDSI